MTSPMNVKNMPLAWTAAALLAVPALAGAAVIDLAPGARTDDPVTNVNDWTLDVGLVVKSVPAAPDRVIFEAGGDGTGTALVWLGSNLVVYQDVGDFNVSTPAVDTFFQINITPFANSVVSIRLDADLSTVTDTLRLTVTNGITTLTESVVLPTDVASIAGANDTGFGLTAPGDIAGLDESAEIGFPNMAKFMDPQYRVDGADVLDSTLLAGRLYTTLANQPPSEIPDPSSWGLVVPEPGTPTLLLATAFGFLLRRRRVA